MKRIFYRIFLILVFLFILLASYIIITVKFLSTASTGKPIPEYSSRRSALVVIDIQEGTTGDLSVSHGFRDQAVFFIKAVNQVISQADSLNLPIIYILQENTHWLLNLASNGQLATGSPGVSIDKRVKVISDNFFTKNQMDAFTNEDFDSFLREKQINRLFIAGLDAAYCVDRTTRAAINRGYQVVVIDQCVISENKDHKAKIFEKYQESGILIVCTENWWLKE